jgi:CBS domain-containing protein
MNEIIHRVNDFLKEFPPFNLLDKDDLFKLSGKVIVKYYEKDEYVYQESEPVKEFIYVVNKGAVYLKNLKENLLVDTCDEGDIFGLRPLLMDSPYIFTAQASENCILYLIKTEYFKPLMQSNTEIALFVSSVFANSVDKKTTVASLAKKNFGFDPSLAGIQNLQDLKLPVTISHESTVIEAAIKMNDNNVNYLIITNEQELPLGIVTDKDFRMRVVAGGIKKKALVTEMMTSPVFTKGRTVSIAELQIQMIRRRIGHVLITEDGTPASKPVGGVTLQDIILAENNNPAIIIKEIRKAVNVDQLLQARENTEKLLSFYLEREISMDYLSDIISEINDQIIKACIRQTFIELKDKFNFDENEFVWISLGSEGRKEQLLRTDQDNALIFICDDNNDLDSSRIKYLELTNSVVTKLEKIGFERCPADMMASNPKWCMSLEEWQNTFKTWIQEAGNEEILHTSIFLDYRKILGNTAIVQSLTSSIFQSLERGDLFLHNLAKSALENPPPLSFFRNFVVERNGEHKDAFDIKQRAMMPLVDAARLLVLQKRIEGINHTPSRFRKMAELEENNRELYLLAAEAYEILMRLRSKNGLKRKNNGRYIYPNELDKFERTLLRNCFDPIHDLQTVIKIRFQVGGIF